MAVYHFTLHAYRSWPCDHAKGFTLNNEGHQPPDPDRARSYDELAKFEPVEFGDLIQRLLVVGSHDICKRRGWILYAVGTDPTHLHLLMGWRGYIDREQVWARLKNILSLLLGKMHQQAGRPWFVQNAGRRRVKDRSHFEHLCGTYLPDHTGVFWERGMPLPSLPDEVKMQCFPEP